VLDQELNVVVPETSNKEKASMFTSVPFGLKLAHDRMVLLYRLNVAPEVVMSPVTFILQ